MRHFLVIIAILFAAAYSYAEDGGVSIRVGTSGFYGRVDIGDAPRPVVIYREPIIIHRHRPIVQEPIYLHVPPGHAKKWHRYCARYNACDRPVYFVDNKWYEEVYVPHYRERQGKRGHGHDDRGRGYDAR